MALWKCVLAYDGSSFHGWQVQPGLRTVQGTLATALRHITGETVLPQGSGRTDTGVHALGQVASFTLAAPIPPGNLLRALNRALPSSLRALSAEHAPESFHARHSARRKTYEYRLFLRNPNQHPGKVQGAEPDRICPPTLAPFVWDYPFPFQPEAAGQAAAHVVGEHDFTSFAATDPDSAQRSGDPPSEHERTNIRTIFRSEWRLDTGIAPGHLLLVYRVTGSGFLHHMVRNLVGTFADAGSGRIAPDSVPGILAARQRSAAGRTAPARGLFLAEVEY